jgi:YlmC/YmxH family sporulation protein
MYKVTDLTKRDIVNIKDGSKLGAVTDMHFDLSTGRITALVVGQSRKMGMFRAGKDVVIPWDHIIKFGVHTVLVDLD